MKPSPAAPGAPAARARRAAAVALLAAAVLAVLLAAPRPGAVAGGFSIKPPPADPGSPVAVADGREAVLVRCSTTCDDLAARIAAAGGVVTRRYLHIDAMAARLPRAALAEIGALAGPGAISKDLLVHVDDVVDSLGRRAPSWQSTGDEERIVFESAASIGGAAEIAALAGAHPEAYSVNAGIHGVAALHAAGYTGAGVIVAVIDSGVRPDYPHLTSDGSIIGGESFVGDGLSYSSFLNNGHGTFVAGMISANAALVFPQTSAFVRAVRTYLPDAVTGTSTIPMIGSAPLAKIYAMRVLDIFGSAPSSVIMAGLDRAIELRRMHDRGEPGGVDIRVVNLSLGGASLNPGRDLFDMAVNRLFDADIVVVNSASNTGPSGMTIGSPGSAYDGITVGSVSLVGNERIRRQLQLGAGFAHLFRPWEAPQMSLFSSRGPLPDGRPDPDVVASGDFCYGMGLGGVTTINLASGTSFSAPTVAGVAALLRQAFPSATARQIRNAIVMSADPAAVPGATINEQGAGLVNGQAAYNLLAAGLAPDTPPPTPNPVKSVAANIERDGGVTVDTGAVTRATGLLHPAQRFELLYAVPPNTTRLVITVADVTPSLPPAGQNGFFGDDMMLWVHSPKTGRQTDPYGGSGDYLLATYTSGGTYAIGVIETGVVRATLLGSWTNAGDIAANLTVVAEGAPSPQTTRQGTIAPYQTIEVPIVVPAGTGRVDFRLSWREDWSNYPVNDVDMIVSAPDGTAFYAGASLADPEALTLYGPQVGTWRVQIIGYELHTPDDRYRLRVDFDGRVVR